MTNAETETGNWTIQKLIQWTTRHFDSKKIESARLDAEVLLAHTLHCKRMDLYLGFDKPLKPVELAKFKEYVKRRSLQEPVAYITGIQDFYGRTFNVGPGVLIPRPETEHLIDEVLNWAKPASLPADPFLDPSAGFLVGSEKELNAFKILDAGCGSGCIGITLALELPKSYVVCVDRSEKACEMTRVNSQSLNVEASRFEIAHKDIQQFNGSFDIIVSNPPYISEKVAKTLGQNVVGYEPHEALFGGEKGYETMTAWLPKMIDLLKTNGLVVIEIGFDQGKYIHEIFNSQKNLSEVQVKKDYSGHNRLIRAIKTT